MQCAYTMNVSFCAYWLKNFVSILLPRHHWAKFCVSHGTIGIMAAVPLLAEAIIKLNAGQSHIDVVQICTSLAAR